VPELPEVETVVRQLRAELEDRTLQRIEVLDPKLKAPELLSLIDCDVQAVTRAGKHIVLQLQAQDTSLSWLAIHLRMTGRLMWLSAVAPAHQGHVRARFYFGDECLAFVDPRRFGTFTLHRTQQQTQPKAIDPCSPAFTLAALQTLIARSTQPIKPWLMRQDRLVGMGNIYACEALFRSKIDPCRNANSLSKKETVALHAAIRKVLNDAIANCGTTFSDFQGAHGVTGSYQRFLKVYGRNDEPCLRCKTKIKRIVQAQRSTFFCPKCQQ